jgi:bifunctional DNA-binding transcriptional regulator/antitoxin component of YhaV-PrlF toxin-antitoxin module
VVIPSRYRRAAGLKEGDEVILALDETGLRILTPRQAIKQAQDLVRKYIPAGDRLADELLSERRRDAKRE